MTRWARGVFWCGLVLTGLLGASCGDMQGKSSKGAGLVSLERMSKREGVAFHRVWIKAKVDWSRYRSVYVKDVDISALLGTGRQQGPAGRSDMEEAGEIGRYMRDVFQEAFQQDLHKLLTVVAVPGPSSLTLEMALTEITPGPEGSTGSGGACTVAFEARVVDSASGKVLAMVADRQQGTAVPAQGKALAGCAAARPVIDTWADQFVQTAYRQAEEMGRDSSPYVQ